MRKFNQRNLHRIANSETGMGTGNPGHAGYGGRSEGLRGANQIGILSRPVRFSANGRSGPGSTVPDH